MIYTSTTNQKRINKHLFRYTNRNTIITQTNTIIFSKLQPLLIFNFIRKYIQSP